MKKCNCSECRCQALIRTPIRRHRLGVQLQLGTVGPTISRREDTITDYTHTMQGQHLNWGIAAAGRITQDFVTALGTLETSGRHAVVAVADVEGERAQEFAQRNQIPRHYDGFDALAQDREVNVVYVGTLNPFHYAVVRLMLSRDKHVLCETPLCLGLAQAKELYALAEQRGLFLMEGEIKECTRR